MYIETKNLINNILKTFDEGERIFTDFMSPAGYTLIKTFAKNKSIDLLDFAFKNQVKSLEMIKKLGGDIFIGTRNCLYSYDGENSEEYYEEIPNWKGTFVILNIYTNNEVGFNISDIRNKYLNNDENFDLNLNFG